MKISTQDRRRVFKAHEDGMDWRKVAKTLGIKPNTAYKWISRGQEEPKKKGGSTTKKTQEMMDAIENVLERENCSATLKELQEFLATQFQVQVSKSTIKNWLDLELYTVKDVRTVVNRMNDPVNKQKRHEYMEKFFRARSAGRTLVWIDETNYNLYCKRKEGCSKIGTRASVILPASKGANLHCIGANPESNRSFQHSSGKLQVGRLPSVVPRTDRKMHSRGDLRSDLHHRQCACSLPSGKSNRRVSRQRH